MTSYSLVFISPRRFRRLRRIRINTFLYVNLLSDRNHCNFSYIFFSLYGNLFLLHFHEKCAGLFKHSIAGSLHGVKPVNNSGQYALSCSVDIKKTFHGLIRSECT